jgi:uncharacterized protein with ParB-like and HNH nuclease domain
MKSISKNNSAKVVQSIRYRPISIREAVENVNNTWFLPAIQRPYDWGERTRKEEFIYKLFDSITREYPIGTLIIWGTSKPIPFRRFLEDYDCEKITDTVDEGLWRKKDKQLVYDGQQRLQSLYSCLKYTFHDKILCYNLLFDSIQNRELTGFRFFKKHETPEMNYIKLNELYSSPKSGFAKFENEIFEKLNKGKKLRKKETILVKANLKQLSKVFVETDIQTLSYYPLETDLDENEVLGIFKRINTTGMQLTNSEILFSELKKEKFDFEEKIWDASLEIKKQTTGISFGPDNILQTLHLIVKGTVRIDPERLDNDERNDLINAWPKLKSPITSFFYDFLFSYFKITHEKIITYKQAMLPLITYFYYMRVFNNTKFKDFSEKSIDCMKKYFITSQLLDWSLQGLIDEFNRIVKNDCQRKKDCDFPYQKIKNLVAREQKRPTELRAEDLNYSYQRWFVLKIITPNKAFAFECEPDERFNPEIDHIFPIKPKNHENYPKKYGKWVETVWNMQPVKGEVNNLKRATLPQDFFKEYKKYLKDYDFLPSQELENEIWLDRNASEFIQARQKKITSWFYNAYGIPLK